MTIAVVVPTNRPEQWQVFSREWKNLFNIHRVALFKVEDGEDPCCLIDFSNGKGYAVRLSERPQWKDLIYTRTDAVRNFGFLLALEALGPGGCQMVLTLDDDVIPPYGALDPIQDHLDALFWDRHKFSGDPRDHVRRVPISWMSTASEYMRGFPYGVREEAEVWVSHGVWEGVHDYDGPTQLVRGNPPASFYRGVVPRGVYFPCCGMNLAWLPQATPLMYFAPMGKQLGVQRFADIWMGIRMKEELDQLGKAVVTGYSTIYHSRASNVLNNLEQEARGIKWNECLWQGRACDKEMEDYLNLWQGKYSQWKKVVLDLLYGPEEPEPEKTSKEVEETTEPSAIKELQK